MTPREIIAKAWVITKKERGMRRWGYASALLETLQNVKLLTYQVWFLVSYLDGGDSVGFFTLGMSLFRSIPHWLFITLAVVLLLIMAIEWLFPHVAKGAVIGLAAKSFQRKEVNGGMILGLYNFFPIFAIHEILFLGSITMTITLISLVLRYATDMAPFGIMLIVSTFCISNILRFFFMFAEEAVVIHKKGIWDAIGTSMKMVLSYLPQIFFLLLIFFVITFRIVLNAIMIFLLPATVMGIGFLLARFLPATVGYSIGAVLGLIIVGAASYLLAYMEVFRQTVWTITYLHYSAQKELDVIVDSDEETAGSSDEEEEK